MRYLITLLLFLAAMTARAGINVPPSTEPYKVITATVTAAIPEGAKFQGGWTVSDGVSFLEHTSDTIFLTAKPGTHQLAYKGFWVHTKTVTFKDGDGNKVSIESYLGSDQVNEEADFTVIGGTVPDPLPDPLDPKPAGPKSIVFYLQADEIDKMPYAQSYLVTSLKARKHLEARGHTFLLVMNDDMVNMTNPPAKWRDWIDAVRGDTLPRVAFAPTEGGVIVDYPFPRDYKHLLELLGETNVN